ncbi:MAG: hypothetical protein AVDCRST_MAG08-1823, partial [uncultured Acetobacteraceae bacterium]
WRSRAASASSRRCAARPGCCPTPICPNTSSAGWTRSCPAASAPSPRASCAPLGT